MNCLPLPHARARIASRLAEANHDVSNAACGLLIPNKVSLNSMVSNSGEPHWPHCRRPMLAQESLSTAEHLPQKVCTNGWKPTSMPDACELRVQQSPSLRPWSSPLSAAANEAASLYGARWRLSTCARPQSDLSCLPSAWHLSRAGWKCAAA